jgi:chromosome segregation ATPase
LDDLEDVDLGDDSEAKSVDSDISNLTDSAFDNLEIKSRPAEDPTLDRPSVSVVVQTVDDEPEEKDTRQSSERISVIPTDSVDRLKAKNDELSKKVEILEKQLIAASSAKKSTISSSEFLDLREALSKKDRELLDLKDSVNGKEKESLNLKDKLTALERQKADLEDRNIEVHKILNQAEQNLENLNVEHEHLKRKSSEQERQIEEFEANIAALAEELAAEKSGREIDVRKEKEAAASSLEEQRERMDREATSDGNRS